MPCVTPNMHISPPAAPALPVPPAPHPEPPRLPTRKMIHPRSTLSSSVTPPTLLCPPARETTSAPFTPPSSFTCPASATRWASFPTPPPAASSTAGSPPSTRQATLRLATLCPMSRSPPRPLHRSSCGGRPAASTCSLPKRFSPASSSSDSATRPPRRSRPSAPSRCVRTPAPPPSRASASAPFPHSARTPPRGLPHSRQPHRDESAIARKPDPSNRPPASSHPAVGQFEFID